LDVFLLFGSGRNQRNSPLLRRGERKQNAVQKSAFIRVHLRLCKINCAVHRHKDLEGDTGVL